MTWVNRAFRALFPKIDRSHSYPLSAWVKYLSKFGLSGGTSSVIGRAGTKSEGVPNDFDSYTERFYKSNGVVFGVCRVRKNIFSQIRFKWRPMNGDTTEHALVPRRPNDALTIFDDPGYGQTTTTFLMRAIQDIDLLGNAYWLKKYDKRTGKQKLLRLRPDRVDILLSDDPNVTPDVEVEAFVYHPDSGSPIVYLADEVVHWYHTPDPQAHYRGMSWMTPVVRDILIEESANKHRQSFFDRGAQSNIAVVMKDDRYDEETLDLIQARFEASHQGASNAYAPIFVAGGADIVPIESDLKSLDMVNVSGRAETHIAMASGIHPTVAAMMEGMQGASLNSGNYKVAERGTVNIEFHSLWRSLVDALQSAVEPPRPTRKKPDTLRLWYSTTEVSILNDDRLEREQIKNQAAETIDKLVREGWEPESAKEYVQTGDITKLVHTGYVSVQLYKPLEGDPMGDSGSNLAPDSQPNNAPKEKPAQPNLDPKTGSQQEPQPEGAE